MEFKVLTLRYCIERGVIDDAPLLALGREHEVLGLREHFFTLHQLPHLLCIVNCRPRGEFVPAVTTTPTRAEASATSPHQAPRPAGGPIAPARDRALAPLDDDQQRLYEAIRRWRNEQAQEAGVPPYVVLTNRDIHALVSERPETSAGLRRIPGIGKTKVERYSEALLGILHPGRDIKGPAPEAPSPGDVLAEPESAELKSAPLDQVSKP